MESDYTENANNHPLLFFIPVRHNNLPKKTKNIAVKYSYQNLPRSMKEF